MARHFVTGAAGFLGGRIVEALHARGERDIVAFDILPFDERKPEGVTYIVGDVMDAEELMRATDGVDYIYHCAALVPLTKSGRDFYNVNVLGTRNVVACARARKAKKLVHVSSSAIYGSPRDTPITDATPYQPVEIYGESKLNAEKEVWTYMNEGGAASCIRPRTIIGGTSRLGIFQILFEWISEDVDVYVMGRGDNLFQFVHTDDLIDAILKAAASSHNGLYNIGAAEYSTLRSDLEAFIKKVGSRSRVRSLPVALARVVLHTADILRLSPLAPWHYLTYQDPFVFDIAKPQKELGWQPKYGNVESLAESYRWYIAHKAELTHAGHSAHTKPVKQGMLRVLKWISKRRT